MLKRLYKSICNRFVYACGTLGLNLSDTMLKDVLMRQSNTHLSSEVFNFIIPFLKKLRCSTSLQYKILVPDDMYKAFNFIHHHLNRITVIPLSMVCDDIPQVLFLKTNFLYQTSSWINTISNRYYIHFKNEEWIIITSLENNYMLCDDQAVKDVIANAKESFVNGAFSSKLYVRPNTNDSQVVKEVESEYFPAIQRWLSTGVFDDGPRHIVDLGGHIGAFSVQLGKLLGENAIIHVFEPEPGNFEMITRNITFNNLTTITPHREAVSAKPSEGTLYFNPEHRGANQLNRKLSYETKRIPVSVVSFQQVLDLFPNGGIDLLKIDIEGSEYDTLMSIKNLSTHVRAIIGEAQTTDAHKPIDLVRHLESQGYTVEQKGQPDLIIFSAVRN